MLIEIQGITISTIPGNIYSAEVTHGAPKMKTVGGSDVEAVGKIIKELFRKSLIKALDKTDVAPHFDKGITLWTAKGERLIGKMTMKDPHGETGPCVIRATPYSVGSLGSADWVLVMLEAIVKIDAR